MTAYELKEAINNSIKEIDIILDKYSFYVEKKDKYELRQNLRVLIDSEKFLLKFYRKSKEEMSNYEKGFLEGMANCPGLTSNRTDTNFLSSCIYKINFYINYHTFEKDSLKNEEI